MSLYEKCMSHKNNFRTRWFRGSRVFGSTFPESNKHIQEDDSLGKEDGNEEVHVGPLLVSDDFEGVMELRREPLRSLAIGLLRWEGA